MNQRLRSLIELSNSKSLNIYFSGEADNQNNYANFCNFYYYTSVKENEAILLTDNDIKEAYLFIPKTSEYYVKWLGKRITKEEASLKSGIDINNIMYTDDFKGFLEAKLLDKDFLEVNLDYDRHIDPVHVRPLIDKIKFNYPHILIKSNHSLNTRLRLIKDESEIEDMKLAIQITNEGIKELMLNSKVGGYEYQLQSHFEKCLVYHNCKNSFDTIMASGVNACCLHYSTNDTLMDEKDLVLADLGARYNYICADITRTFPVNGKFSKKQRAVYQAVLNVNKECIKAVAPGVKMTYLNDLAKDLLARELINLGLIKEKSEVSKYYYHSIGHQLGMLCHDLTYKDLVLEEGMVITIEPGLYIEEWGIGIRIEDDILVTKDSYLNLSSDIIKEVDDIEEFMR